MVLSNFFSQGLVITAGKMVISLKTKSFRVEYDVPQSSWAEHSLKRIVEKKERCALHALGCKGCSKIPMGGFLAGYSDIRDTKRTEEHTSLAIDYHLRIDPPKFAWLGKLFEETSGPSFKCISFFFSLIILFCSFVHLPCARVCAKHE